MTDNQTKDKDLALSLAEGEDSSVEMDIIQQALKGEPEPSSAQEPVFDLDIFAAPPSPSAPHEVKTTVPSPPPPHTAPEPTPVPAPPTQNLPEKTEEERKPEENPPSFHVGSTGGEDSIKIVTDDDLKSLFEQSVPGIPPAEASSGLRSEVRESPVVSEEEITWTVGPPGETAAQEGERIVSVPETVSRPAESGPVGDGGEEITSPGTISPAADGLQEEKKPPLEDISPEEIIDQLELRAEVGEMTAVAAGKKGQLLERTAVLISSLEPAGEDLMSVAELRKLFKNMDLLIQIIKETNERLSALERRLGELREEK